ncbi:MAG: NUDIX hydrolase [Anaerolineales bacterium]
MITFTQGKTTFIYRAAAVALSEGQVLLHRSERDDFWSLPGGRVEFGEPAELAIRRELREELGVETRTERLLWVVEQFFEIEDERYHELGLYFLISLPPSLAPTRMPVPCYGDEAGLRLSFRWFMLETLPGLPIKPAFLKTRLSSLPKSTAHLVMGAPGV